VIPLGGWGNGGQGPDAPKGREYQILGDPTATRRVTPRSSLRKRSVESEGEKEPIGHWAVTLRGNDDPWRPNSTKYLSQKVGAQITQGGQGLIKRTGTRQGGKSKKKRRRRNLRAIWRKRGKPFCTRTTPSNTKCVPYPARRHSGWGVGGEKREKRAITKNPNLRNLRRKEW